MGNKPGVVEESSEGTVGRSEEIQGGWIARVSDCSIRVNEGASVVESGGAQMDVLPLHELQATIGGTRRRPENQRHCKWASDLMPEMNDRASSRSP